MVKTVLVTGAAGFIGSHLLEALLERGDAVVALDNFDPYYAPQRKQANLAEVRERQAADRLEFVQGDVRDRSQMEALFRHHHVQVVAHLAALAGVRASVEDPARYYDVNIGGTTSLLEAARATGGVELVLASTSSVYGSTSRIPFIETDAADRPLAPYPATKRAAEILAHSYHHLYGMKIRVLRFFSVYGPRGRPDMMPYKIADSIAHGTPLTLYEAGKMSRDWTYVTDIVAGIVAAVDNSLGYEIFNLGRGQPVAMAEFVSLMEAQAGRPATVRAAPSPGTEMRDTYASIEKAERFLGYQPTVSVAEGIDRFWRWYTESQATD